MFTDENIHDEMVMKERRKIWRGYKKRGGKNEKVQNTRSTKEEQTATIQLELTRLSV